MRYPVMGSVPTAEPPKILRIDLPGLKCDLVSLGGYFDEAMTFFYAEQVRGYLAGDHFEKLMLKAFDASELNQTMVDTPFHEFYPSLEFLHAGP